jgi:radical SAM superfamily enzyme YgiQ (UPF0313 family)
MRVLLIQPPIQDFYDTDVRLQPIGLGYLKAVARAHHPDVEVFVRDYHQGHGRFPIPIPPELKYLKEYYLAPDKSPFRAFYQYFHFGLSFDKIRQDILELKPDAIGISSLFTPYFREVAEISRIAKAILPHVPVLVGGSHVSACPHEVLSEPSIDFIIRGEGERPFVEWLEYLKENRLVTDVSGLGYKIDGVQNLNPLSDAFEINEVPIPDFSDLNPENYKMGKKNLSFLITSRSCPHRCSFCSVHQTFGTKYRRRTVQNVIEEIRQRFKEGYRVIDFEDDNLTFYKNEMKELCLKLIEEFSGQGLEFVAMNGISYISLDDELLELMKKAGFTHLNLALVSSDETVRNSTKRPHTTQKYLDVVKKAFELGFHIVSYQILGLPNEKLESMIQTLRFNARLPVLLGASMFYLTPNTPIAKDFGYRTEKDRFLSRLTSMQIETNGFVRDQIFTLFITTRILDFLKGLPIDQDTTLESIIAEDFSDPQSPDPQSQRGIRLLQILFSKGQLFCDLGDRLLLQGRFLPNLFFEIFHGLDFITTRQGKVISISPLSADLKNSASENRTAGQKIFSETSNSLS